MFKPIVNLSMHTTVKNPIYFALIYLNLINYFYQLSANTINKSLQTKCPSSLSSFQLDYDLSRVPDHFIKHLALNYSYKLFGLKNSDLLWKRRRRHNFPPQYMLDLYSSVSNNTFNSNLKYNSKTIRSVTHSDTSMDTSRLHFYFNLSQLIGTDEHIIEAEFHIYKLRSEPKTVERREDPKHNLLEVKVYQILSEDQSNIQLLDVRRMSTHSFGWDVFYVKKAVIDWLRNQTTNYGLSISVTTLLNEDMANGIRFVNRYQNHVNKQPMIVIFSSDKKRSDPQKTSFDGKNSKYDYGFSQLDDDSQEDIESIPDDNKPNDSVEASKEIPSTYYYSSYSSYASNVCLKRQIYIDFERIGWTGSVIFPKGFTITICEGECTNRVKQNSFAKSDTTLTNAGLLHYNHPNEKGCCFANKFSPLNVLFIDERGNVVLKRIKDLIANDCGCLPCHSCH